MPHPLSARPARLLAVAGLATAGLVAAALPSSGATAHHVFSGPSVQPDLIGHHMIHLGERAAPPTTAQCQKTYDVKCYSPLQYETAYGVRHLFNDDVTGRGRTIAVADAFGSPTIKHDLRTFDAAYGLPNTSVRTIHPSGKVPKFNPNNSVMTGWAGETTLDVEYAHAMAPEAKILVVATPVAETEGVHGLPELMHAERYVIRHHLADVISQSFGATENTFHSKKSLLRLRYAFKDARRHHVTVLASSGDAGATDSVRSGNGNYPYRVNSWPSVDPLVTSVGGTMLDLTATGHRIKPDVVWNDGYGAGGGGKSLFFKRPAFQNRHRKVVHDHRGTPDISMSAAVNGGALVYSSYDPKETGWAIVGGTSEASPLFAGIVALADQVAHKRLGYIDPALYRIAAHHHSRAYSGIVDVRKGNNSFDHVHGYKAKKGYDLASGLGTVNAPVFVRRLAKAAG